MLGWFEGKPDKDFDDLITDALALPAQAEQQERWRAALARTCVVVGKLKKAEEILRQSANASKSVSADLRMGHFYFDQKKWAEAAAEYSRALERERTNSLALYLRGIALVRAGQVREGRVLAEQARLVLLADEAERYNLIEALIERGLTTEANEERRIMTRTCTFRSIYATNAYSALGNEAARQKRPLEAARCFRRVYLNLMLRGGAFIDSTAYLRVPGLARFHEARGLLFAGKLDAAIKEGQRALEYMPHDIGLVIELVRALDQAKRKTDADKLFEAMFARHQTSCADYPKAADFHNRLAWLAVRCGRQLEVALKHAQQATDLSPDSPGFLDTLAEVHFQRGEQEEALKAIKRALRIAPDHAYYRAQLKRMEAGDPRADLPEQ
jgi:tetratricopeptide (TPR) repeat protein